MILLSLYLKKVILWRKLSQNTLAHQTRLFSYVYTRQFTDKFTLTFTVLTKRADQTLGPNSEQQPRLQPQLVFHPHCLPPPPPFPSLDSEKKQYLTAYACIYTG